MRDGAGGVSTGAVTPAPASGLHTVRPGDTLLGIARQYGVTLPDLVAWNQITDPNQIHVGQTIRVSPAGTSSVAIAAPGSSSAIVTPIPATGGEVGSVPVVREPVGGRAPVAEPTAAETPAPATGEDRMTVYLATTQKPKEEAAAPAAPVPAAPAEAKKGAGRSEPVLVAKAETPAGRVEGGFAPERDALADSQVASAEAVPRVRAAAENEQAARQETASAPARLGAAAPAPAPPGAERPSPRLDLVGTSSAGLRLSAPARLDGLTGPFDGSYRLELTAAGRVSEVVRLFGGSGTEPPALPDRLRTLSFASSNGAPLAGPVDVRVRLP